MTFTAPDDWVVDEGFMAYADDLGVGVIFDGIANIYAEGCQWVLLDPPVGPTVDDLVAAWANLPDFAATAAVDVTVDGYAGKQFELTVPAYNRADCKTKEGFLGVYALWDTPGMSSEDAPGYFMWSYNLHLQIWVLDVDGTRLVIGANTRLGHIAAEPSRPRRGRGLHPDRLNLTAGAQIFFFFEQSGRCYGR